MAINFDRNSLKQTTTSSTKPILFINKIVFRTADINWVHRLFSSSLIIRFSCIGENGKIKKSSEEPLDFAAFITPYHKQAVMEVNRLFYFTDMFKLTDDKECHHWETSIELEGLPF